MSSAVPLPIVPITTAPSQSAPIILPALFALAMAAGPRPADQDDTPLATPGSAEFQPLAVSLAAIAPPGDAQRQSLDMGQRDWPQKMIDHIEALRDNANANDTSIRLKPDALGQVDVALKTHEDGAISVRFIAEQPTTRTLIADAAPQLAQAAEARGIRLSGTSVDLTGQGGDPRSQAELERRQPITNHLTAPSGDDGEPVADDRVA
ncbi:MAG TPA: flagellar hook-length control protein FliK [Sphingomonas sp.]|nr:flagellar hook-length control protein FliK [Sphingomonas sp.]